MMKSVKRQHAVYATVRQIEPPPVEDDKLQRRQRSPITGTR